jgi:PiT family inorganic phosphate transporter
MNFLIILGLSLTFLISYVLGANDAATPCDTSVGSGVISIKKALILFCIFTALGALTQGYMVIKTRFWNNPRN